MPMWCSSSDKQRNSDDVPKPHHRIVRIPPGEAVVLNSAERAPYLLYSEILSNDLDFDCSKRSNKEILRRIITKEGNQRSSFMDFGLASATTMVATSKTDIENGGRTPLTAVNQPPFFDGPPTATSSTTSFSNTDEEIDLVEQLYGGDQPLRSKMFDIEDSVVLPPTPKNRELDMAAWSRASPLSLDDSRLQSSAVHGRPSSLSRRASTSTPPPVSVSTFPGASDLASKPLSLDEYSERMRTAAIMLAQLNADQARDPLPAPPPANGSSRPEAIERSSQ